MVVDRVGVIGGVVFDSFFKGVYELLDVWARFVGFPDPGGV